MCWILSSAKQLTQLKHFSLKKKERTNKKWESMFAEAYNHESRVQLFEQTKKTGQKSK